MNKPMELTFVRNDYKNKFTGILNYLRMKSGDDISKEVIICASSMNGRNDLYSPNNITIYEDPHKFFFIRKLCKYLDVH